MELLEILIVLFILFIVLAVITVVGHGIWVLLALIFRGGRAKHQTKQRRCVFCGRSTPVTLERCDWCGRDLQSALAEELADLESLARQLKRFKDKGRLKPNVVENLLGRVLRYRRQLVQPPGAQPAVHKAIVAPVEETTPREEPAEAIVVEVIEEPTAKTAPQRRPPVAPRPEAAPVQPLRRKPPAAAPVQPLATVAATQPANTSDNPTPAASATIPAVAASPPAPQRSWGEMLAAFMEERNILWGELVGGLLVVGASVALVLSLWDKIKDIEYSPFLIIATISSAILGVGLYAHHRWKLASTSRGLLIIGTLLVPLSFLVMGRFPPEQRTLLTPTLELGSLALFSWLVSLAFQVLAPKGKWLGVLAVVGNSAVVLLAPWLVSGEAGQAWLAATGCLPVAIFVAAAGGYLLTTRAQDPFRAAEAGSLFTLLGNGVFTLTVVLGLLAVEWTSVAGFKIVLECLSVPLALAAVPVAASGLRTVRDMAEDSALQAHRTAGTTIAILGIATQVVAICLVWPQPVGIVLVGAINAAALLLLAFHYRFPAAHAGAMACMGLAYLAGFHLLFDESLRSCAREDLNLKMLGLVISARSGTALVGLFVLFGAISELIARTGGKKGTGTFCRNGPKGASHKMYLSPFSRSHGEPYIAGCGVVAVLGLILVTFDGLGLRGGDADTLRPDALRAAVLYGIYGAGSLGLLARWRKVQLSYLGLGLLAAAPFWAMRAFAQPVGPLWATVMAAEALLCGAIATLLHVCFKTEDEAAWSSLVPSSRSDATIDFYRVPLQHVSEVLATLAVACVFIAQLGAAAPMRELVWPALSAACISALYLLLAWGYRSMPRFAVHQLAAIAAALVATTAWLVHGGRVSALSLEILHPRNLHSYGICLGLLTLAYLAARIVCAALGTGSSRWLAIMGNDSTGRSTLDDSSVAHRIRIAQDGFSVDWIVRHALVVLQLLLIGFLLMPGVGRELIGISTPAAGQLALQLSAGGPSAWLLLGVLAAVMVAALWHRWRNAELVAVLLLAATVPCLIAARFAGGLAVASSLRWGLTVCFVVCSFAVWERGRLLRLCRHVGANVDLQPYSPRIARVTLLLTTAGPVLALTVVAGLLQFIGVMPSSTVFGRLWPSLTYVLPLLLIVLGLVGHAVRERSAPYAFGGGLVTELIVTLGYVLVVTSAPPPWTFGVEQFVTMIQLATITAVVWAAAWLNIRQRLNIWRELPTSATARSLMNVQLGMAIVGNLLLILLALLNLSLIGPRDQEWSVAAGGPLGWIALAGVMAAAAYRRIQLGKSLRPQMVGFAGMAVIGLLACSVTGCASTFGYHPGWGYRTLMLGWATYALFIVSATWWVASIRTMPGAHGPPQTIIRAAAVWVRVAGILAVLLGLKAALFHGSWEESLWAAGAISVASLAGATMAVWRRREGWAFSAALGVNLAASLVISYFQRGIFNDWWWLLVQANVIASAAVALAWLAARKRLYELRELTLGESPLLATQVLLPVVGNVVVLAMPVLWLLAQRTYLPNDLIRLAEPAGWVALLLSAVAAAWYLRQAFPGRLMHVLGGAGLGVGVLLACCARVALADSAGSWSEYHTLTAAWAAVGALLLAIGLLGRHVRLADDDDHQSLLPRLSFGTTASGTAVLPASLTQAWTSTVGVLVVVLAILWSTEDTSGAWWRISPVLAIGVSAGVIALWRRQAAYVFISGLLLNVAGSIAWIAWGPSSYTSFIQTNVLCLAVGSIAWTLLGSLHPSGVPHPRLGDRPLPFAHLAAVCAVGLLWAMAMIGAAGDVLDMPHLELLRLDWIALVTAAVAVAICLWDRNARFPLAGLYFLGLSAAGMSLIHRDLSPGTYFLWTASCELTGFVLVAALLGWGLPRMKPAWTALLIPDDRQRWSWQWFFQAQAVLSILTAALAAWVSIDFSFDGTGSEIALLGMSGRLAGRPAALMLVGATILMAWQARGATRSGWQMAAMAAGVLFSSSIGWAALDSDPETLTGQAPWLHRGVNLMVSAAMMTLLTGFGLGQGLPRGSDWIAQGRRAVPVFGCLALLMLVIVLGEEVYQFAFNGGIAMATWAVLIVAVALAGLVAGCLGFALVAQLDPMNLSDRGRTVYVYAAEALAGLICLHLGLTRPEWFDFGIIKEYWMLIVLVVAFCGEGLSEVFHRKGLPVLSEPLRRTALLLPIVPALAFWFVPVPDSVFGLAYASPATWLLIGLFYGVMAASNRSLGLAALSILSVNTGLWVLWQRQGLYFTDHPQLWLIPIATAALVAEYLDRRRLNENQHAVIRYCALSVIYVSSTTEFLRGIGDSIYPTLILIGLSVAGVLLGIMLRVRSFLYLGVSFLLVVIVRMIYYAAFEQGQMWVLWTFCILLGAAIIALFAVFEKRRNDVLAAVERFKEWER